MVEQLATRPRWKGLLESSAPLPPRAWLAAEIDRLVSAKGIDQAVKDDVIEEARRIAGDGGNPHATASAAEFVSLVRLPNQPRRNGHRLSRQAHRSGRGHR